MLHIIKSPQAARQACSYIHPDDSVILIEASVYCALPGHELHSCISPFRFFVLKEDIDARGLGPYVGEKLRQISYSGFVDLTAEHSSSMTWD